MTADLERLVSSVRIRLSTRAPFFGAVALFARVEADPDIPATATDGQTVYINPAFWEGLSSAHQESLYLHAVLHAALLHVPRGSGRELERWNIAADIVVNGILSREGFVLPETSVRHPWLEQLSVEEVYDLLARPEFADAGWRLDYADLRFAVTDVSRAQSMTGFCAPAQRKALEDYWRQARKQIAELGHTMSHGLAPASLKREVEQLSASSLNWRHHLWRFLAQTPSDFTGFDRRFVGRRVYLDTLAGETVHIALAIDTSGSIDRQQLTQFMSEVSAILAAYPHLTCDLYFADAEVTGPYRLSGPAVLPEPVGGGGTDFQPFFNRIAAEREPRGAFVAIYLTDGWGEFPPEDPPYPVLWVVAPGGLDAEGFPFGEVVRLVG
jgi:predicted metal-dependent peptidase